MRRWFRPRLLGMAAAALITLGVLALVHAPGSGGRTLGVGAAAPPVLAAPAVAVAPASPPAVAVRPEPLRVWAQSPALASSSASPPTIGADAAIVLDEASASVLYEKDAHARIAPASLTKIMTALLALERGNLSDQVAVNVDSRRMRGSTVMGLVPGERLSLDDLLYGLLLPSGNDAALAVAEHVSGPVDAFVALMNERAAELGLADTHFVNPHGLDGAGHYSSAYDLALLTRAAMQRADFRRIVGTRYYVAHGALNVYQLGTLNPLYGRIAGVDGVKTGFTRGARQALVGSVLRDGHRVYVVVLHAADRTADSLALLNWTFAAYIWPAPSSTVSADAATGGT